MESHAEHLMTILDSLLADCHLDVKHESTAFGVTASQYQAMLAVEGQPLPMQEVANRLLVSASTVTRVIDQLVRRGLVRRVPDKADRRSIWVHLTQRGKDRLLQVKANRLENSQAILSLIEPEDQQQLIHQLMILDKAAARCREVKLERWRESTSRGKRRTPR
jgi:DNA-binding MarR family transcriptional regulator